MFGAVVREKLLRGIVEFLHDHDVDTDQVVQQQTLINNNRVTVTGSKVKGLQVGGEGNQQSVASSGKAAAG
jgi:hypothetical protein